MRKSKIIYNPTLTVAENAQNNNLSESSIRRYIRLNGIDRHKDNAIITIRAIDKLRKDKNGITISGIAKALDISINTVKKYIKGECMASDIGNEKLSTFDTSRRKFIISSVSESQDEILANIIRLYIPSGKFHADFTYSIGNFYNKIPNPLFKFDKYPQKDDVLPLYKAFKIPEGTLNSVVFDLPFIVKGYKTKIQSLMIERFNHFNSVSELYAVNKEMLTLSYEKLKKGGMLVIKTMDFNYGGRQYWVSNYIQNEAEKIGFRMIDLFILIAKTKVLSNTKQMQRTARKFHSYFMVFSKK